MATIDEVAEVVAQVSRGTEAVVLDAMAANTNVILRAIHEQLYSGLSGTGAYLSPTYQTDPYFDEPGTNWYQRNDDYQAWKATITPPETSTMLGLPPRPLEVPNLFINGKFYTGMLAYQDNTEIVVSEGPDDGAAIVAEWGREILTLSPRAVDYFNTTITLPAIGRFFTEKGVI